MTKKYPIYMIDFLCQIEILLLNMLKLFKIPGFSRIPGKVATLLFNINHINLAHVGEFPPQQHANKKATTSSHSHGYYSHFVVSHLGGSVGMSLVKYMLK